ncbi:MAG: MFS transporter [Alphaproteobacteria bacterium]|nr:MFS transporter [Alphaproteobacteria bacterium]MDX5368467.1 MFS transporter [Alphaproteobacteria bacterium]MDX5463262.1 MFS transporter [Alphaproteobacteria bacterium]
MWLTLVPVLASAGILLAGSGLLGTLVPVRGRIEGFSPALIGLFGSAFFIGYMGGCVFGARIIKRAGHIRAFAALAAIAASAALLHALSPVPVVWLAARFAVGFCGAGLSMVVESWLNARAEPERRGRVLGVYRMVDLGCVTAGQLLLPLVGPEGFELFAIIAMLYCLALVPVALTREIAPAPPEDTRLDLRKVVAISPLAAAGCVTLGLTNGAFRQVGPLYAEGMGLDLEGIAVFMIAAIVAGALTPIPLGWLSDRFGRRRVLVLATGATMLAGLWLSFAVPGEVLLLYAGSFAFGAFAMPLYSLSIAHAADRATPADYVMVSAGLLLCFSIGASVGPLVASLVIERFGAPYFFTYTSVLHGLLLVYAAWRMATRADPQARAPFRVFNRTSPEVFRLGKKK